MLAVVLFLVIGAIVSTAYLIWAEKNLPEEPAILSDRRSGPSADLTGGG